MVFVVFLRVLPGRHEFNGLKSRALVFLQYPLRSFAYTLRIRGKIIQTAEDAKVTRSFAKETFQYNHIMLFSHVVQNSITRPLSVPDFEVRDGKTIQVIFYC